MSLYMLIYICRSEHDLIVLYIPIYLYNGGIFFLTLLWGLPSELSFASPRKTEKGVSDLGKPVGSSVNLV